MHNITNMWLKLKKMSFQAATFVIVGVFRFLSILGVDFDLLLLWFFFILADLLIHRYHLFVLLWLFQRFLVLLVRRAILHFGFRRPILLLRCLSRLLKCGLLWFNPKVQITSDLREGLFNILTCFSTFLQNKYLA